MISNRMPSRFANLVGVAQRKPVAERKQPSAKAKAAAKPPATEPGRRAAVQPAQPVAPSKPKPAVAAKSASRFAHLNKAAIPLAITRAAERPAPQSIAASWEVAAIKAGAKPSRLQQTKPNRPQSADASWDRAAETAGLNRHRAS